ncbi:hypothetical protein P9X10_02590 [Bacillus cereus]|nr:hypothetical protein [Bacillus cereus]
MLYAFVIHGKEEKQEGVFRTYQFRIEAESFARKLLSKDIQTDKVEIFEYDKGQFVAIDTIYNIAKQGERT